MSGDWYLDCFAKWNSTTHPLNSYGPNEPALILEAARRLLANPMSGIDEIRISTTTLGCSPLKLMPPAELVRP